MMQSHRAVGWRSAIFGLTFDSDAVEGWSNASKLESEKAIERIKYIETSHGGTGGRGRFL